MSAPICKNFIDIRDFDCKQINELLDLAKEIKGGRDTRRPLKDRCLGLLFSTASTRTRVSFHVGIRQLGGSGEYFNMKDMQLSNHESIVDTAEVLGRYLDGLIVRNYDMNNYGAGRAALLQLAQHSGLPTINALDDKDHPCQALADLMTLKEKFGERLRDRKVVLTWAYADRQKSPGVPHSLLSLASILGLNFTVAYPEGFDLDPEYTDFARRNSHGSGATIEFSNDLTSACRGADVIYAKSWKSLTVSSERDLELRNRYRPDWMVQRKHFDAANKGAYFMNCMPLVRGQQASADVVDAECSIIYDQAENRLHAQKAILCKVFERSQQ
jgi:ornithine carbamoyltransferase